MPLDVDTRIDLSTDDRVRLWLRRDQISTDYMQQFQSGWASSWKRYLAKRESMTDPLDWWRSNETIPECFKIIETLLPRHVSGMFGEQEWFTIQGRERSDEPYEKAIQSLLLYWVDRSKFFPKAMEAIKYALIMGHVWGKVVWREETQTRIVEQTVPFVDEFTGEQGGQLQRIQVNEEVFNDPDFNWITLDRLKPDPTGRDRYFIEDIDITLEELEETNDQLNIYKNLGAIHLTRVASPGDRGYTEPQSTEGISQSLVDVGRHGKAVRLKQCWGWVPSQQRGRDGSAWRLVVIANDTVVIRDVPAPTPDGRPPYFPIKTLPIPKRIYSASILDFVGPLQDQQSRIANFRLDEVFLNIWGQYIYDRNAGVTQNEMLFQPGGAIGIDVPTGKGVRDVFAVLERKPVLAEAYQEEGYRQSQAESVAAAFDEIQGRGGDQRKTATESERNFQQGNARFQLTALWLDHTFKREVLTRAFQWYQKRLPPNRFIRIVGQQDSEIQLDITQIQAPVDITVTSGIQAFNKDLRIGSEQELIALAGNPGFEPYMKKGPILREFLSDRGWKNVEKFVNTDEEVAQLQQQQLEQQRQLADEEVRRETAGKVLQEAAKPRQLSGQSKSS